MKDSQRQISNEIELIALSRLLLCWAQPKTARKRRVRLPNQLDLMASAVISGLGSSKTSGRGQDEVPAEVRRDDRDAVEAVLKAIVAKRPEIHDNCFYEVDVETELDLLPSIRRRLWLDPESVEMVMERCSKKKSTHSPSDIRDEIVSRRLDYAPETIKKSKRKKGKPIEERRMYQKHLASLYFDVVRYDMDRDCMTMILDALGASQYHPLQLYYLVRSAPHLDNKIVVRANAPAPYLKDQILDLCEAVIDHASSDKCPSFRIWDTV